MLANVMNPGCNCCGGGTNCKFTLAFPPICPEEPGNTNFSAGPSGYYAIQSVVDSAGNPVTIQTGNSVDLSPGVGTWTVTSVGTVTSGAIVYANNPATTTIRDPGCPQPVNGTPGGTITLTPPTISSLRRTITFHVPTWMACVKDPANPEVVVSAAPCSNATASCSVVRQGATCSCSGTFAGQTFSSAGNGSAVVPAGNDGAATIQFQVMVPMHQIATGSFSFTWLKGSSLGVGFISGTPILLPNDVTYNWTFCNGACPRWPVTLGSLGYENSLEPTAGNNCPQAMMADPQPYPLAATQVATAPEASFTPAPPPATPGPDPDPEATCRACDQLHPTFNHCNSCRCPGCAWMMPACPLGKW